MKLTSSTEPSFEARHSSNKPWDRFNLRDLIKSSQDAFERFFEEREDEGEVIQQSSKWVKGTIWSLMGTATFAVSWLAIAKTDEVVTVIGKLEPLGSVRRFRCM